MKEFEEKSRSFQYSHEANHVAFALRTQIFTDFQKRQRIILVYKEHIKILNSKYRKCVKSKKKKPYALDVP